MPAPIVMVHGGFCGGWAFEAFRTPFEQAGHICITPDLPGHGRDSGHDAVRGLSITDYVRATSAVIADCAEPPLVVGHSLGGLVAQLAASSAPVKGLMLLAPSSPWGEASGSMEEAGIAVSLMSLGAPWLQVLEPDQGLFAFGGLDRLDGEAQAAVFARMVPESGRALWETFNWWLDPFMTTRIQSSATKAPALVIGGELDRIHGPASARATAARLGGDLHLVQGMSHWLIGEPGWRDVAEICLDWMKSDRRQAA